MTKTTMPEPVAAVIEGIIRRRRGVEIAEGDALITTDQAGAYAAAKVREALEEVEFMLTNMYTDAVKARVPEAEDEEGWNSDCLERALALQEAVLKIRTLTPA